ncbi:MAG: tetratricopeptide repeat protein [Candidatus Omnitrophota bacterium]
MRIIKTIKRLLSKDENIPILLAGTAILVYFLCLPNQMFWDDDDFILKNAYIQDWQYWPKYFIDNVIAGTHLVSNYWRPLLQTIFASEWHLWANWVYGWHATSIACHAGASIFLFLFLNSLLKDRTISILAALLWLVHPVHTEAVVYPNSMGDSLATLFIMGGLYAYTLFRQSNQNASRSSLWWIALLMYPLALLSKETGILLVAFLALTDFFFLTPATTFLDKCKRVFSATWPFVLIAVIYLILRGTILNFNNSFNFYNGETLLTTHPQMRLWTFFRVISLYTGFIFFPYELRVERTIDIPASFFSLDVIWGGILCLGLIGLAVRNRQKRPAVSFGVLWFFAAILPTSNLLVLINALIYEHFLYTALIGILIIVLTLSFDHARMRRNMTIIFIGITLILGIRSAWRCIDWRTAIGFYEQLIPYVPKSYRVANNLAMSYAEKGMVDKAMTTYLKAVAIDPNNAVAYHNIANIYRDKGQKDLAQTHYEKAIALQANFIFSYKSLAQIYIDQQEYTKARRLLENYFQLSDEKVFTLNLLAEIAYREKDFAGAKHYLLILQQIQPDDPQVAAALRKLETLLQ